MRRLNPSGLRRGACVGALALQCILAHADPIAAVNQARLRGCASRPAAAALRPDVRLNAAAAHLARGESLHASLTESAYRAQQASSVHLAGISAEGAIARELGSRYCSIVADRSLTEIGVAQRRDALWIVIASPISTLGPRDAPAVGARALQLANQVRATGQRCGEQWFAAARPLSLSARLSQAALEHSRDMAAHDQFQHTGHDGSTAAERVRRTGYAPRGVVGENIAAGAGTADEVMRGWLASPGHCANLMDSRFTQMGIGYVIDGASESGIYWTQVLASPN